MKLQVCVVVASIIIIAGCAPRGPVVDTGARPTGVGGTIAGTVRGTAEATALSGRKVTAVNETTNARFETSTGTSGAYTLKVPAGTYRLEVELRNGESLDVRPEPTDVSVGDIDSARDFVVTRR
jgi:hypothetical protein